MLKVLWSDHLENLAEGLFRTWEETPVQDPFARTCIVVGDAATQNWLQSYFLLHHRPGHRRVLANVDFRPIAEFVNDWLAAMMNRGGNTRDPSEHPYAKGILAWRIDAILRTCLDEPDFGILKTYIHSGGPEGVERRRFDLATRLAQTYDDYLGSRYMVLAKWAREPLPAGDDRWQAALYKKLVEEVPETYVHDYETALAADADPARAFERGFCRYETIHVFDVAVTSHPFLQMLRKISEAIPTCFWNFNPSRAYWLDDPSRKERARQFARRLSSALAAGLPLPETSDELMFETPDAKLLGALAQGAKGVLSAQLDLDENGCDWLGDESATDFSSLRAASTEVHICHSPRRELEVARDALHRFFDENPDARPCDALVLCTDWATYSPLVESVFRSSAETFPVTLSSGIQEETPISHSLEELLAFRDNRFEVDAVLALLAVPAIRRTFDIGPDGLMTLREMVRDNTIRWGYDDTDVRQLIGLAADDETYSFTWRRGLDRWTLDALMGPRDDERELVPAGPLGRIMPRGNVESERARLVGALSTFVQRLADLRHFLRQDLEPEQWRNGLFEQLDDFYDPSAEELAEMTAIRRAVDASLRDVENARKVSRYTIQKVSGELVCLNVLAAMSSKQRRLSSAGDAVRIAPLQIGSAVPARFVWICGLQDGSFPRSEYRPSFDLIGRAPTLFDVDSRKRDTLSLLKAALGARDRLSFSYVGRDVRSNEEIPASVPLADILEWFRASQVDVKAYVHPLQAFSARYFRKAEEDVSLPPSYSCVDRDAAVALAEATRQNAESGIRVRPFALSEKGETRLDVEELADFYSRPHRFLACERLGLRLSKPGYDAIETEDELVPTLPADLARSVRFRGEDKVDRSEEAARLEEEGHPFTEERLKTCLEEYAEETQAYRIRRLRYAKKQNPGFECVDKTIAEAFVAHEDASVAVPYHVPVDVDGHLVFLNGVRHEIGLTVDSGDIKPHVFWESTYNGIFSSQKIAAWIHHLAGHAAGGSFVTVLVCAKDGPARTFRPVSAEEAKANLVKIIRMATNPMICDLVAARNGGGELPEELATVVNGYETATVSTSAR